MLLPTRAQAQGGGPVTAGECCLDLLSPLSARVVGLGQAVTARAGIDGVFVNPASLAELGKSQLVFHRTTIADASASTVLLLVHSRVAGNFGLTYTAIIFEPIEATDQESGSSGSLQVAHAVLVASYATTIGLGWTAGVNYRLYHEGGSCTGAVSCESFKGGTTSMLDAGLRYTPRYLSRLNLGASVMHLGFPLQVNNAAQANPTPVRLRVGAAYDVSRLITRDTAVAVWLNVDAVQRVHDATTPAMNFGVEVVLDNIIYLRGGHTSATGGTNSAGNGVGLGVKYQRFDINIAKAATSSELYPAPVYVSFGISF